MKTALKYFYVKVVFFFIVDFAFLKTSKFDLRKKQRLNCLARLEKLLL